MVWGELCTVSCLLSTVWGVQVLCEVYGVQKTVSCVSHRPNVYMLCVAPPSRVTLSNPRDPSSDLHSGFMWLFRREWRRHLSHLSGAQRTFPS